MTAIILTGFMGTGKSTVGRLLAERLGKPFIDVDERIQQRTGCRVAEIFSQHGETFFRQLEREELAAALAEDAVVSTGGGAMLDPDNVQRMKAAGPIVCLSASVDAILARTATDTERPLLQHGNRRERVESLLAERASAYAHADVVIDTTQRSPEEVVEAVLLFLGTVLRAEELPA